MDRMDPRQVLEEHFVNQLWPQLVRNNVCSPETASVKPVICAVVAQLAVIRARRWAEAAFIADEMFFVLTLSENAQQSYFRRSTVWQVFLEQSQTAEGTMADRPS